MRRILFEFLRSVLVLYTGRGYDRAGWLNNLHHKLAFRLHKALPFFGITGVQRVPVPWMPGRFMYVRAEDGGVAHQLIMYQRYEPYESKLVREYVKSGMIVYNIGANLGYYALLASECVGPSGQVVAFEPEPKNLELLRRTILENGCANVVLVSSAVSERSGEATLSLSPTNSGDHQLRMEAGREHIQVSTVSIDDFISQGQAPPDAIIMDVQGAELDVLRGAESLLRSNAPLILFTEFWPGGLNERHTNGAREMLDILKRAGFQIHRIEERRKELQSLHGALPETKNEELNLLCVR